MADGGVVGTRRTSLAGWSRLMARALLLVLTGCGLFSIRDPNAPEQGLVEHLPNDPDSVPLNFALGVAAGQEGTFAIQRALADTFRLKLDPVDAQRVYQKTNVFLNKSEVERGWSNEIGGLTRGQGFGLELKTEDADGRDNLDAQTVRFRRMPYFLVLYFNGDVVDTVAAGRTTLYLQERDSRWYMSRWEDEISGSKASFGALVEQGSGHQELPSPGRPPGGD
jgi:hypothetical protein